MDAATDDMPACLGDHPSVWHACTQCAAAAATSLSFIALEAKAPEVWIETRARGSERAGHPHTLLKGKFVAGEITHEIRAQTLLLSNPIEEQQICVNKLGLGKKNFLSPSRNLVAFTIRDSQRYNKIHCFIMLFLKFKLYAIFKMLLTFKLLTFKLLLCQQAL